MFTCVQVYEQVFVRADYFACLLLFFSLHFFSLSNPQKTRPHRVSKPAPPPPPENRHSDSTDYNEESVIDSDDDADWKFDKQLPEIRDDSDVISLSSGDERPPAKRTKVLAKKPSVKHNLSGSSLSKRSLPATTTKPASSTASSRNNLKRSRNPKRPLPTGLVDSDASDSDAGDREADGDYQPLEIGPLLNRTTVADTLDAFGPDTQETLPGDNQETQPREDSNELRLPGHQQCAAHVLHLVSGDVDTALGKLKEGELEGRPEAYRSAMGKLGVLWRVKRKSSQASMVLVGCTLNHLCFAPLVFGKICVLEENR